jgi:hypothetical protein
VNRDGDTFRDLGGAGERARDAALAVSIALMRHRIVVALLASLATPSAALAEPADFVELRSELQSINDSSATTAEIRLTPGTVYSLSGDQCAVGDEDGNEANDLDVVRPPERPLSQLTIYTAEGATPATIAVDCPSAPARAIEVVRAGTALVLRNMWISGGRAPSGGDADGGGVRSPGAVTLDRVVFSDNRGGDGPSGVSLVRPGEPGGHGGAVSADGKITVLDSVFRGNRGGAGGAAFEDPGCDIPGSSGGAGGGGGALHARGGLDVQRTLFLENRAGSGGKGGDGGCGAFSINGQPGGDGGAGGRGGSIWCQGCSATVLTSTFSASGPGNGGPAGDGGARGSGDHTDGGNGGVGGAGGTGGAVAVTGASGTPPYLRIDNSTVDGTLAGQGGSGGSGGNAPGSGGNGGSGGAGGASGRGAISVTNTADPGASPATVLIHVTLTDSGAVSGGAGGAAGTGGASSGTAGNAGAAGGGGVHSVFGWRSEGSVVGRASGGGPDCWTQAASSRHSAATDATCGFDDAPDVGVRAFADFALGPLGDNGGPTPTRVPGAGSVLLDRIPAAECTLNTDQRGLPRPAGAGCEVGAVEVQPPPPSPPGGETPGDGGTGGGAGTPTGAAADTVAPRFLSFALSPTRFAAFRSGPSVRRARTRSTRVSYRLSEAATVTFRVQRVLPGRRVRGRCVRPTRADRTRPRCRRYRTLRGSFSRRSTAGLNRFRFSGRLAGRRLRPGSYRLVAVARDPAGNSSTPVRRLFQIIR